MGGNRRNGELRCSVFRELDEALSRLGSGDPTAPAAQVIAIGIGYFANLGGRHLGHTATRDLLEEMSLFAREVAEREQSATRN